MKFKEIRKIRSNSEVRAYLNKLNKHFRKSNYKRCIYI